jgi:hypothetical protein
MMILEIDNEVGRPHDSMDRPSIERTGDASDDPQPARPRGARGGPGDLVFKPRGVAHTFWNDGDEPARLLELISPAGFENYFRELAPLLAAAERDEAAIREIVARFRLDIDFATIPVLAERHNLRLG